MSDGQQRRRSSEGAGEGTTDWLVVYGKGIAMGAADTVPGVSGGTIALVTGIYERLIEAVAALDPRLLGGLKAVHTTAGRRRFVDRLREADVSFLLVLGLGVLTALVVLSRVLHGALVAYRAPTFAFFLGLIAAASVVLYRQIEVTGLPTVASALGGFGVAFVVSGVTTGGTLPSSLPVVFASGAIAVTALVLPGISGALILLLLGQYAYLLEVLTDFVDGLVGLATGGTGAGLAEGATVVGVFATGAAVGLFTAAHAVRWALERYRHATLAFLVSLMVGSLRLPVIRIGDAVTAWTPATAAGVAGGAVLGAGAVLALDRYTADLEYATG